MVGSSQSQGERVPVTRAIPFFYNSSSLEDDKDFTV